MSERLTCEVLIVGGGMSGLTLGLGLARAGLDCVLVDREDPKALAAAGRDARASALARASKQALEALGLWPGLAPAAQPILAIRVSDGQVGRPAGARFLHCDRSDLDGTPLGYLVENHITRRALAGAAEKTAGLRVLAPAALAEAALAPADRGGVKHGGARVRASLADGRAVEAGLVVAADGARSPLRQAAGIAVRAWAYPQSGIVCTLAHERPHGGVAFEHFLPSGPFAVLPLVDGPAPGPAGNGTVPGAGTPLHRSSIVWTERHDLARHMMAVGPERFAAEAERRFGPALGGLALLGKRWIYPLRFGLADRMVAPRLALLGDAAHSIHPIADQGLNLGLRDAAALTEVLTEAKRLGQDLGSMAVLRRYERWRRADNTALALAMDGLNRLFSNDLGPLRLARDLGLAAVGRLPAAKRLFMRQAMGLVGDLPPLLEGRPR